MHIIRIFLTKDMHIIRIFLTKDMHIIRIFLTKDMHIIRIFLTKDMHIIRIFLTKDMHIIRIFLTKDMHIIRIFLTKDMHIIRIFLTKDMHIIRIFFYCFQFFIGHHVCLTDTTNVQPKEFCWIKMIKQFVILPIFKYKSWVRANVGSNQRLKKNGIYSFSAKHAALRSKSKDWLARKQNNVSEWSNVSTRRLLFQWADTLKIQLSVLV